MSPLAIDRDKRIAFGREKTSGGTVQFGVPGIPIDQHLTDAPDINTDHYYPFHVESALVIDRLQFEVTAASAGNARIGIYAADRDSQPVGGPLCDSGDISTGTTGVQTFDPSPALTLPRGRYLSVLNNTATFTGRVYMGSPSGNYISTTLTTAAYSATLEAARSYAAFPTPGTKWTTALFGTRPQENYVLMRWSP